SAGRSRSTPGASASVSWSSSISSSSTPSVRLRPQLSPTDRVHGAAGRLPRVVRGARPEAVLVRDDPRVAADLLRALGVPEQVRVVALLPDEDEVGGGHEVGHERAAVGRTGKGVGANAEPAGVVAIGDVVPVELVL